MKTSDKLKENGIKIMEGEGPYYSKRQPDKALFVAYIEDRDKFILADEILQQIARTYRSVFGRDKEIDPATWAEGFKCNNCDGKKSLELAYGVDEWIPLDELEKNTNPDLKCLDCGEEMVVFHEHEQIIQNIRDHCSAIFGAIILNEQKEVIGFFYNWVDTLSNICEELLSFLPNSSAEEIMEQIKQATNGNLKPDTKVLYIPEIAVELPYRDPQLPHALARGVVSTMPDEVALLPTISITRPDKMGYMFLTAGGHKKVYEKQNTDMIIVSAQNAGDVFSEFTREAGNFFKIHECFIAKWKKENIS